MNIKNWNQFNEGQEWPEFNDYDIYRFSDRNDFNSTTDLISKDKDIIDIGYSSMVIKTEKNSIISDKFIGKFEKNKD